MICGEYLIVSMSDLCLLPYFYVDFISGIFGNILLLSASGQLFPVSDNDSLQGHLSDLDYSDACMPKIEKPLH